MKSLKKNLRTIKKTTDKTIREINKEANKDLHILKNTTT